jgi:hypothetical protein
MPQKERLKEQKELEDTLEAALDEGEPVVADDPLRNRVRDVRGADN